MTGSQRLTPILDLGSQALTGVFPRSADEPVHSGPLELVFCHDGGLVQLRHSYDAGEMYGENYGYRSGLNAGMVRHLEEKVRGLRERVNLGQGDIVLDIGSNDSTLLRAYPDRGVTYVGIDPTGTKFSQFYPDHVRLVPEFFSYDAFRSNVGTKPCKIVTSIAMFYDLEAPLDFMLDVSRVLAPDGIWHFEQSYLPSMLEATSYDTACHEHLEYYGLSQILWMTERAGLDVIDVELNRVNGGSFAVTCAPKGHALTRNDAAVEALLEREEELGLADVTAYGAFADKVVRHRQDLVELIRTLNDDGKRVLGYGASTKGNVILQYCGLTADDLTAIAEVNPDKFGCFTPGTLIPIVSETEAKAMRPDYLLVLPWHFREGIIARERDFLAGGGRLIFPMPEIEVVDASVLRG
jgi:hypothetical protein